MATSFQAQAQNRAALDAAARNLSRVIAAAGLGAADSLEIIGTQMLNAWRTKLSTPGRGRVYKRGRRTHRASAPGDPPAPDTGATRARTAYAVTRSFGGPVLVIGGGSPLEFLEVGTRRMAPRPSLRPVIAETAPRIPAVVATVVEQAQRRAAGSLRSAGGGFVAALRRR